MTAPVPHTDVLVVGAGFAGVALTRALLGAGHDDFVVLEQAAQIGGTWRDNTYPGCRCDVESVLYSFSFAPNPRWSHTYAAQPEILAYLTEVARQVGVLERVLLECRMDSAEWDDRAGLWRIMTTQGPRTARVLIAATGPFNEPCLLDLPGQDTYRGRILHTARWPTGLDLSRRRVAVIGTGASAVQVVPAIQPAVSHLTVIQRTPAWVPPRTNTPILEREQDRLARDPAVLRRHRMRSFWTHELIGRSFAHDSAVVRLFEAAALRHLHRQVADPALRAALTPDYRLGCKRVTPSDDYYPALTRDNVTLVPHAAESFTGNGVVTGDGAVRRVDTVVLATGFVMAVPDATRHLVGRGARSLYDAFSVHPQCYLGTAVHGFPNLFLVPGPGTGQGHTSVLLFHEAQAHYVAQALTWMRRRGVHAIEVDPDVQQRYNAQLQDRVRRSVFAKGGCHSWYQDSTGQVALVWPASTRAFRRATAVFDPVAYHLRPA